jgi:uncharacterized protein (TIGR03083 family)
MEVTEHVAALDLEGPALFAAADKAGLAAPVPTCPEWTVRDLLRHIGFVHRWAASYVRDARPDMMDDAEETVVVGPLPDDHDLLDWCREGHAALVATLRGAPVEVACWSFLPAPSPLAFWARRQAHETSIHRADAQAASGPIALVTTDFALDGIDELLMGFMARRGGKLRSDATRVLAVRPTDATSAWTVRVGPDGRAVSRTADPADCELRGSASELYLALWNRRTVDDLDVTGDRSLLDLWRERATVRWS